MAHGPKSVHLRNHTMTKRTEIFNPANLLHQYTVSVRAEHAGSLLAARRHHVFNAPSSRYQRAGRSPNFLQMLCRMLDMLVDVHVVHLISFSMVSKFG